MNLFAMMSVGMISKVRHRQTGVEYALKTIQLEKVSSKLVKEMRNEIEILKRLDHPNIIRELFVLYSIICTPHAPTSCMAIMSKTSSRRYKGTDEVTWCPPSTY